MNEGIQITLTCSEIHQAALVGAMRGAGAISRGLQSARGIKKTDSWWASIEGSLGELALAKYLNLFWNGSLRVGPGDVGKLEVRTRSEHRYDLMIHKSDPDEAIVWLLTGAFGQYRVRGWIRAKDGKKAIYWRDPAGGRPTYFVPASALNSPESWRMIFEREI